MTKIHKGLTTKEVIHLREKNGFNEVINKKDSLIIRLLKKIINPITLMIEIALLLSYVANKWEDFFIILALLFVNIGVDIWQEGRASKALKELKKNLAPEAVVLRDGKFKTIPARELVPNDVIKISIGDIVPADVKISEDELVQVDQSTITGESLPAEKHNGDILYSSSIIQKGSFVAIVTDIGKKTFIGKSTELVAKAEEQQESHFQKAVINIGKFLAVLAIVLVIIVAFFMWQKGDSLMDIVQFSLILAISSIPVALPAVLSVTMAIGASKLSKKRAIVSNAKAVEELAGVTVLCVDKTGTLTKNEITIKDPIVYGNFKLSDLFIYGILTSEQENKNKIELAIEHFAKENKLIQQIADYSVTEFVSFTPTAKTTEASVQTKDNGSFHVIMGAPQIVADILSNKEEKDALKSDVAKFAQNGFRALAIVKQVNKKTLLVGMMPMYDPPRDDSKKLLKSMRKYGFKIKMITGDNTAIARFIASALDMGSKIINTKEFSKTENKAELINKTDIFTEVIPEDKYNIIDTLQKDGHIVAMTGDGVNDAPAIKKADIGIAVAGASPAAQSAADVVLLDPGLSAIETALEHARQIFARMQSYATFRIAETIRIIFFVTISMFVFGFAPLPAILIVILALLNDIPVMAIAYDNAPISKKPVRWHLRETITISSILGATGLVSSFILLYVLVHYGFGKEAIYTLMFLKLDVSGHSTLYTTRTGHRHFWAKPYPSLKFFLPAFGSRVIGTIFAYFGIFMTAISWQYIAGIWIYSTLWFIFNDQIKVFAYKILHKFNTNGKLIKNV
jgi:H+-transporting ATPase